MTITTDTMRIDNYGRYEDKHGIGSLHKLIPTEINWTIDLFICSTMAKKISRSDYTQNDNNNNKLFI